MSTSLLHYAELQLRMARTDGNVTFTCSSGLEDSREIPIFFNYTSLSGLRSENNYCQSFHSDALKIYQDTSPPYDCVMNVINPDAADSGMYQCYAVLSNNEYAVSNAEMLAVTAAPSSKGKAGSPGDIVAISVVLGVLSVLAIIFSLVFIIKTASKCKHASRDEEHSPLVSSGGKPPSQYRSVRRGQCTCNYALL